MPKFCEITNQQINPELAICKYNHGEKQNIRYINLITNLVNKQAQIINCELVKCLRLYILNKINLWRDTFSSMHDLACFGCDLNIGFNILLIIYTCILLIPILNLGPDSQTRVSQIYFITTCTLLHIYPYIDGVKHTRCMLIYSLSSQMIRVRRLSMCYAALLRLLICRNIQ